MEPGGPVMSPGECSENRMTDHRLLTVPSKCMNGNLASHPDGLHCRRSVSVDSDAIRQSWGQKTFIGDTIMVAGGDDNEGRLSAHLVGLFRWYSDPGRRRDTVTINCRQQCPSGERLTEIQPFRLPGSVVGGGGDEKGRSFPLVEGSVGRVD